MSRIIQIVSLILFMLTSNAVGNCQASQDDLNTREANEIINKINFDKTKKEWKLRDKYKLERTSRERSTPEFKPRDYTVSNTIMYIVAIVLVAMLLFVIFTNIKFKKSEKVSSEAIIEDDIVAFKPKTAFEQALEAGDYRMAIRYRFLHVLKNINEKELIKWAFEKTNRDYLREFKGHPLFNEFRQLVNTYEMVWYGNTQIDKISFDYLDKDFEFFINQPL